jgi:hypothetical protein
MVGSDQKRKSAKKNAQSISAPSAPAIISSKVCMVGLWYGESCDKPARIWKTSVVVAQVGGWFVGSKRKGVQVGVLKSELLHGLN